MKSKLMTAREAVEKVKDGDAIMVGGFLAGGHPEHLVYTLLNTNPAKD